MHTRQNTLASIRNFECARRLTPLPAEGTPLPAIDRISNAVEKAHNDLFLDTLKDIYFDEKQILKTLPKMARAEQSGGGKANFLQHRDGTRDQGERPEQIFKLVGKWARGKTYKPSTVSLPRRGTIEEYKGTPAFGAGLIASAQAVENDKISRYDTLKSAKS